MMKEFFGVKFLRTKYSALDGRTTVSYEEQTGKEKPFRVLITSEGLWFSGVLEKKIASLGELEGYAELISICWGEHVKLAPKITTNLRGH